MIREIDDQGAANLIAAIVGHARNDVLHTAPDSVARKDAEDFFRSEWFEQLTGTEGEPILKELQAEYERKHKKKGTKKHGFE